MVRDIKKILEEKLFKNSDEEKISKLLLDYSYTVSRNNISFVAGILSFKRIPSALRLAIIMKKGVIIKALKEEGLHVRDIL